MEQQQAMMVRPPNGATGMQTARQGFGEQALEQRNSAATAMAERAKAEVQAMHIVALQRPRHIDEFRVQLLDHCKRRRFAAAARYAKPVGNATIEGASIRFVEAALQCFGNVVAESAIIFEDDEQIVTRVTVTDLERNIKHHAEATVRKRMERRSLRRGQTAISQRVNSQGIAVYIVEATDDDVANIKASRESKMLRNLGLRLLPPDVVEEAMDLCKAVLKAEDAKDPAAAKRQILDAFHGVGVSPAQVAEFLGHPLEQLQPAELTQLRELFQSIRDGETTWTEILAARRPAADQGAEAGPAAQPAAAAPAPLPNAPREGDTAPATPAAKGAAGAKQQIQRAARARQQAAPAEGPSSPPAAPSSPAAAPAAAPDDLERRVIAIREALEHAVERPETLPKLRSAIEALPEGPDQERLLELLARAEVEVQDGAEG